MPLHSSESGLNRTLSGSPTPSLSCRALLPPLRSHVPCQRAGVAGPRVPVFFVGTPGPAACAGCSESIRVRGPLRRPPTRSCSRRRSSDPALRSVRRAASRPALGLASAGRPLAASTGLQARGAASRLHRPEPRNYHSRRLAGPAGDSLANSRTGRQNPVLAHGPLVAPAVSACTALGWLTGHELRQPSAPDASSGSAPETCTGAVARECVSSKSAVQH